MAQPDNEPQIAVFIDWHNIAPANRGRGRDINLNALLTYIHTLGRPRRQFVYLADFRENVAPGKQADSRFVKAWERRNFVVSQKVVSRIYDLDTDAVITDGNLDVELTIDVVRALYEIPDLAKVVLFSGDGDFYTLLQTVRDFRRSNPIETLVIGRKADTNARLRHFATQYIPLESIMDRLGQPSVRIA